MLNLAAIWVLLNLRGTNYLIIILYHGQYLPHSWSVLGAVVRSRACRDSSIVAILQNISHAMCQMGLMFKLQVLGWDRTINGSCQCWRCLLTLDHSTSRIVALFRLHFRVIDVVAQARIIVRARLAFSDGYEGSYEWQSLYSMKFVGPYGCISQGLDPQDFLLKKYYSTSS
jgi:hypothetical protein